MDLATISALVSPPLAAFLTWIIARRKSEAEIRRTKAETSGLEIGNVENVINLWKGLVSDLSNQVKALTEEVTGLRKENIELKKEMQKLEGIIQNIKR